MQTQQLVPMALMQTLTYVLQNSNFYKKSFKGINTVSNELSFHEWRKLPFTSKDDISENNLDFLAVPMSEIADFVTTSGTMGDPVTIYLSRSDLKRLAINERDSLALAGVKEGDLVDSGQVISKIGLNEQTGTPMLHFEVRLNGKPVDPLSYLPSR